jgi:hypothetical protein
VKAVDDTDANAAADGAFAEVTDVAASARRTSRAATARGARVLTQRARRASRLVCGHIIRSHHVRNARCATKPEASARLPFTLLRTTYPPAARLVPVARGSRAQGSCGRRRRGWAVRGCARAMRTSLSSHMPLLITRRLFAASSSSVLNIGAKESQDEWDGPTRCW